MGAALAFGESHTQRQRAQLDRPGDALFFPTLASLLWADLPSSSA